MHRRLAVAAALLLLPLAACSEDPEPVFADPAPSSSASPTTDPVDVTPTEDSEPLGPEETVEAWVDARNAALVTGGTADLRALTSPSCRCGAAVSAIERVYSAGGRWKTTGWRIVASRIVRESGRAAEVSMAIRQAGGLITSEAGADPVRYAADKSIATVQLDRLHGTWRVSLFGFVS